jgi:hypothetical protein
MQALRVLHKRGRWWRADRHTLRVVCRASTFSQDLLSVDCKADSIHADTQGEGQETDMIKAN